jgi:phosphoacetylglucosamine mutase
VYLFNEILKPKNITKRVREFEIEEIRKQYWENFCSYFNKAAKYLGWEQPKTRTVDCANGVGGHVMPEFCKLVKEHLQVTLYNVEETSLLNNKCGADYVKTELQFPRNYKHEESSTSLSFDGDADRIVFL